MTVFKSNGSLNQNGELVVKRGLYKVKTGMTTDQVEKTVDSKLDERLGKIENIVDEILGE